MESNTLSLIKKGKEVMTTLQKQLLDVGLLVEKVEDSEDPISIFINQDDINRGLSGDPLGCAAAQCLQRATGGKTVAIFLYTAYVQLPNEKNVTRYLVPKDLRENVVIPQDTGGTPISGAYTLQVPKGTQRIGQTAIRKAKLALLRSKGLAPPAKKRGEKNKPRGLVRWIPKHAGTE